MKHQTFFTGKINKYKKKLNNVTAIMNYVPLTELDTHDCDSRILRVTSLEQLSVAEFSGE